MELEQLEPLIRAVARRYCGNISQIDDYEQELRLKAWKIIQEDSTRGFGYFKKAFNWHLSNKKAWEDAKKRKPEGGIVSLQQELTEDGLTLEDVLGKNQEYTDREDLLQIFHRGLRDKYGKFYISMIKKSHDKPKLIARKIIRGLLEEVEGLSLTEIPQLVDYRFFIDRGLARFLWVFYKNSPFSAVSDAYGDTFVPWEFRHTPMRFWKGRAGYERAQQAIKWFCQKRGIETRGDCSKVKMDDFQEEGLITAVAKHFNSSPFLALKTQFPDLEPWEANFTPKGFFNSKENVRSAILAFIIDKTGKSIQDLNPEETYELGLRKIVSKDELGRYGLRVILVSYGGSPYRLFTDLFPEQILPWTLSQSKEVWKENPRETAARAVRWLFDDYLKIPLSQIPEYASNNLFWRVGFSGILTNRRIGFSSSPYSAVNNAYPKRFSKTDFDGYGRWKKRANLQLKDLRRPYQRRNN